MISEKRSYFANVKTRYGRLGRDQHNSDGLMPTNFVTIDIICLSFYLQNEEFSFSFFFFQKLPNFIMGLNTMGTRVVVSDIQESFHFVKFKARENHLVIFADDVNPRYVIFCFTRF